MKKFFALVAICLVSGLSFASVNQGMSPEGEAADIAFKGSLEGGELLKSIRLPLGSKTADQVTVFFPMNYAGSTITIEAANGTVVYSNYVNAAARTSVVISTAGMPQGAYVIRIVTDFGNRFTGEFVL